MKWLMYLHLITIIHTPVLNRLKLRLVLFDPNYKNVQ